MEEHNYVTSLRVVCSVIYLPKPFCQFSRKRSKLKDGKARHICTPALRTPVISLIALCSQANGNNKPGDNEVREDQSLMEKSL